MKQALLALAMLCSFAMKGQHLEVGISIGNTNYIGDIVCFETNNYMNPEHLLTGTFFKYVNQRFAAKLGIMTTKITGNDAINHYPKRGFSFESKLTEIALTGEFEIFRIPISNKKYFAPYAFGGIAVFRFNPKAFYKGHWVELQPLGTEGQGMTGYETPYKLTQIALPFGAGLKYQANRKIALSAEVSIRKLFTDYLDDVGGREVNFKDLVGEKGRMAGVLSVPASAMEDAFSGQRTTYTRGSGGNDLYLIYQLNLSITLGSPNFGRLCPKF